MRKKLAARRARIEIPLLILLSALAGIYLPGVEARVLAWLLH